MGPGQQSSDRFGRSGLQMRWSSTRCCCCTRFVYSHSWTFAYCTLALASARATPHITQGTTSAWTCICMYVWRLQRSLHTNITTSKDGVTQCDEVHRAVHSFLLAGFHYPIQLRLLLYELLYCIFYIELR